MVVVYLHTQDNASLEIVYGTQARYPCHLPSVLSGCQGQEICCHVERIILHYLYCQFYSISDCIVSYSLTLTVVKTLKRPVQLSLDVQ